jgi:RHS repeat-associated protein
MKASKRVRTILAGLMATTALAAPAAAQQHIESTIPPVFQSVDENGVDQISGQLVQTLASLSIGPGGPGSITYNWANSNSGQSDVIGFVAPNTPTTGKYSVTIGGGTETFTNSAGTFTQDQGRGSTLTYDSGTAHYTYTGADGRVAVFGPVNPGGNSYILSLTYPAGQALTYYYRQIPGTPTYPTPYYALRSVVSNLGYQIHYDYALAPSGTYYMNTGVVLFNRANEACDPNADTCSLTGNWPRLSFTLPASTETDGTDNLGRLYRWINTQVPPDHNIAGTPGTSTMIFPTGRTLTFAINQWGQVTSANDGRGTWQYQRPNPSGGNTLTFYPEQNGPPRQVNFETATGHILSEVHTLTTGMLTTSYSWTNDRISAVSVSNGSATQTTQYTYDARGNVTQVRRISATPGTPADIVTSAVYPSTCTNLKTCNQPTSTTDARGNTTDYTYDPNTGALLSLTLPAGANGVRPQTLYGYTAYQAYYLDNAGSIVASGSNVTQLTSISSCVTGSAGSCTGTSDEARTTVSYGPQAAGTANNLLPVSTTSGDGTGALAATLAMTYTPDGDVDMIDGPVAGNADTVRTYYDGGRRPIGEIGPDPDGAGALPRPATRTTYNADNEPTIVEAGTATDQSATGMSTFTSLRQQVTAYDAQDRATSQRLNAGGTTYSLTQMSTTLSGFPECTAVRMNQATFASPPASACTQGTAGADGPDRITRIAYDGYRRLPVTVTTGVGTALEASEETTTYDTLNRVSTIADGQGNLATNEYDGFGRRIKLRYPSPTSPGQSSTTDYEQLTFDAAGNVTNVRLRDGNNIAFTYDNLGRVVFKDLPGSEPDVTNVYDNLGRLTGTSETGDSVALSWDALGRQTASTSVVDGTSLGYAFQYDSAGRRTRLTYPDGVYLTYDFDVLGRTSAIRDSGGVAQVSFGYDSAGRRNSLAYANGVATSYTYDPIGRLATLSHDFAGTNEDVTFSYSYNAASQITSRTASNNLYAFNGTFMPGNGTSAVNGLNQYSNFAGGAVTYDARGNLTSEGGRTFAYDSQNRLVSYNGSTLPFRYDAAGRLLSIGTGSQITFDYEGSQNVAERNYPNGPVLRRHAFGPRADEPMVWYEGSGTSDRRFVHADERGTTIAISDSSGATRSGDISSFDEFGRYGNAYGRFLYAGRMMVAGLSYNNARFFDPSLGRFLQPDPIDYGAGMNIYNYVHSDPINRLDPFGLSDQWCGFVTTGSSPAPTHYGPDGAIVVTAATMPTTFWCGNVTTDVFPHDQAMIDAWRNHQIPLTGDEQFLRFDGNNLQVRPPAQKRSCPGGVNAFKPPSGFYHDNDDPGHTHPDGYAPWIGPDDGVAAQRTGTAYMVSTEGVYRINHNANGSYSASRLAGNWGASTSVIRGVITRWNHFQGASVQGGLWDHCTEVYNHEAPS